MRKIDRRKNLQNANILAEQRYLKSNLYKKSNRKVSLL